MLYNYPFLFQCLKSKLRVPFRYFRVWISDRKKCLKSKLSGNRTQLNCLKSKLVRISDINCTEHKIAYRPSFNLYEIHYRWGSFVTVLAMRVVVLVFNCGCMYLFNNWGRGDKYLGKAVITAYYD